MFGQKLASKLGAPLNDAAISANQMAGPHGLAKAPNQPSSQNQPAGAVTEETVAQMIQALVPPMIQQALQSADQQDDAEEQGQGAPTGMDQMMPSLG